jgi:hypothetical protein
MDEYKIIIIIQLLSNFYIMSVPSNKLANATLEAEKQILNEIKVQGSLPLQACACSNNTDIG